MPIPDLVNDTETDSGFADWKQNVSRWGKNAKVNHGSDAFGFS